MPVGRVIRIIGGFYYIMNNQGETIVAVPRGKLKLTGSVLVGDLVDYEMILAEQAVIEGICPRSIVLKRPFVSNVTQVALIFAHKNPDFNYQLIDRFLVMLETYNLKTLILFNKSDLIDLERAEENAEPYRRIGYQAICTSTKTHQGKLQFLEKLCFEATVLTGPSGVGKSALINMVAPSFQLKTGAVSEKIGRGRHTTREAQLLPLPEGNGYIFDTPGFTQLDLDFLSPRDLADCFIEFAKYKTECHFLGCLHQQEPACGVKAAVEAGKIYPWRYEHYLMFLDELNELEDRKYLRSGRNREQRR
ncbi:MAG TPA: ribosome small subunit-dependent GTPase A [Firmicutes bacterium]|nr:ribosome small subunit-dependent GTPase A [Bacillota bacterium]